jgi:hypothetical protein
MSVYNDLKNHPFWNIIEKSLYDLEDNQDIELKTESEYVTGYLVKKLIEELSMVTPIN